MPKLLLDLGSATDCSLKPLSKHINPKSLVCSTPWCAIFSFLVRLAPRFTTLRLHLGGVCSQAALSSVWHSHSIGEVSHLSIGLCLLISLIRCLLLPCPCCALLHHLQVVPGGGAVEAALSVHLEKLAETLGSREQLAIAEFAEALLVIPKVGRRS